MLPGPVSLKEGRVVDDGGQQGRESPEQQGGEELGDDGILSHREEEQRSHFLSVSNCERLKDWLLTLRNSTGLVTLNLSMVEMMMAGVVRKNSRMNRMQLMTKQRIHQEIPPSDRCSLQGETNSSPEWGAAFVVRVYSGRSLCTYQRTFCGSGA